MNHDFSIDITAETCPFTFIRTKLALENMTAGQVLEVEGRGHEPRHNVPAAVRDHGHTILELVDLPDDRFRLRIRVEF